jgi:hypothetical protein
MKITGSLYDGTKISAKGQFIIGKEWSCIPVVYVKKETRLSFMLWLNNNAKDADVVGLGNDVAVGKPGKLKAGAKFTVDEHAAVWNKFDGPVLTEVLPLSIDVTFNGKKWIVADGKSGKVKYLKGTTDIDWEAAKLNPSGLKLSYKTKDGSFKGSFKVYYVRDGKLKSKTMNLAGVLIDGVAYGSANVKNIGSVLIAIDKP